MANMERRPDSHGKVRDIYQAGENLLMVATDRISAFDYILPDEIPFKGEVLNRISAFWFDKFADLVPNHLVSIDVNDFPAEFAEYRDYLAGRAMLVRRAETIPVECIVRGYLTGSGKKTYDEDGTVCGIALPAGLTEASKLPEPIFTPSTKAALGDHDENISFDRCVEIVGEDIAEQIRDYSLKIYSAAAEYAATRGSSSPTPSSSSASSTARSRSSTSASRRIRAASGPRRAMRRAPSSRATTNSTCAIGSVPTGT